MLSEVADAGKPRTKRERPCCCCCCCFACESTVLCVGSLSSRLRTSSVEAVTLSWPPSVSRCLFSLDIGLAEGNSEVCQVQNNSSVVPNQYAFVKPRAPSADKSALASLGLASRFHTRCLSRSGTSKKSGRFSDQSSFRQATGSTRYYQVFRVLDLNGGISCHLGGPSYDLHL